MQTDPTMLRRGLAALFAGSMLFGVAACGDDDATEVDTELEDPDLGEDIDGDIGGEEGE